MPKWVRESSAVSGPEWAATQITLPTLSSQSWASWLNRRIGPYLRYENEPYVEHAPQKPLKDRIGSSARLTLARPTVSPALVNSVICCGSSAPRTLVSRLYQPQPGRSSQSLAKPAMLVDSARSAEQAMTSGRSYSARA